MTATTGISGFGNTQIGVETTPGASTDLPTTHWRGEGVLKDLTEVRFIKQKIGVLGGTLKSYIPKNGSEVTLSGDAAFETLPYIFNAAFYGVDATTDAGSCRVRTWSAQYTSTDLLASTDLDTLVIETGDNIACERSHFHYVREYTLSASAGEAVQINAILPGQQCSTTTAYTSVGATDFSNAWNAILSDNSICYIDPSTDTPGTTRKSVTMLDWNLKHVTGWQQFDAKDGRTDFGDVKHVDDEIELTVRFEHNANAETERAAWRAQTERVVRIDVAGPALATTDANHSTYLLRLDCYGKWASFGADGLEEQNGDNIYTGVLHIARADNVSKKMDVTVISETGTLP